MNQKVANGVRDLFCVGFQREVAGIEEAHIGIGNVALESLCASRQEERVVLAPHGQEARLVRAEVFLESGIERRVALIVAEQVKLDFGSAGTREIEVVEVWPSGETTAVWRTRCVISRIYPNRKVTELYLGL